MVGLPSTPSVSRPLRAATGFRNARAAERARRPFVNDTETQAIAGESGDEQLVSRRRSNLRERPPRSVAPQRVHVNPLPRPASPASPPRARRRSRSTSPARPLPLGLSSRLLGSPPGAGADLGERVARRASGG